MAKNVIFNNKRYSNLDRFCSCDSYTDFIWYKKGGRTTIMMKMIMLILSLNDHDSLMYLIEN